MTDHKKYYPSKILLFGEYTIIDGSNALAIPFKRFKSRWNFDTQKDNNEFVPFIEYLMNIDWKKYNTFFNQEKLFTDLKRGLYFDSNIPVGYGAGSSGSITAALFDSYFKKNDLNIYQIKNILSLIEGFFHGVSSGIDPMVSYLNKALKLIDKKEFELIDKVDVKFNNYNFYLLDTKVKRETKIYVDIYNNKIKTKEFKEKTLPKMIFLNNNIISSFLISDEKICFSLLNEISSLQYKHFKKMIIPSIEKLWIESLGSEDFSIKLCGAGGGGFYLLMIKKEFETNLLFNNLELIKI